MVNSPNFGHLASSYTILQGEGSPWMTDIDLLHSPTCYGDFWLFTEMKLTNAPRNEAQKKTLILLANSVSKTYALPTYIVYVSQCKNVHEGKNFVHLRTAEVEEVWSATKGNDVCKEPFKEMLFYEFVDGRLKEHLNFKYRTFVNEGRLNDIDNRRNN